MEPAYFALEGEALVPTAAALSMWSDHQLHGVAVSGALARAAEHCLIGRGRGELRPARYAVDLFRPATKDPCMFRSEVVREGNRLCLVDVELVQGGERVARASTIFLKPTAPTAGAVWEPTDRPAPPPHELIGASSDAPHVPFVRSDADWSQNFVEHQNAGRKLSWSRTLPIVAGEPMSPFQAVAATADGVSLVTNWGTAGVEYINTDITLTLARLPEDSSVGLAAIDRVSSDGIAVGTATVFDRSGPIGTAMVSALANAQRAVDLGSVEYDDDGSRRAAPGV